jgi:hypothetical protein
MKYFLMAVMTVALIGILSCMLLGMNYVYEGWGLHPWLAGFAGGFCLLGGYWAASRLQDGMYD